MRNRPPMLTTNAFCPTGPGGKVDPTCAPGNKGTAKAYVPKPRAAAQTVAQASTNKKATSKTLNDAHAKVQAALKGDASAKDVAAHLMKLDKDSLAHLAKKAGLSGQKSRREIAETIADRAIAHARSKIDAARPKPDGSGSPAVPKGDGKPSPAVAAKAGGPADKSTSQGGNPASKPAGDKPANSVPADHKVVMARLERLEKFFDSKGQGHVSDWIRQLKDHINAVGPAEALKSLGAPQAQPGKVAGGKDGPTQYWGVGTEEANWKSMGHFMEAYLTRHGVKVVTADNSDKGGRLISALGKPDRYVAGKDFKPEGMHFKDKLTEAKHLPGLEKSEDLGKLMGTPHPTHLDGKVIDKLDSTYGKGQWIVKCYDDNAAAGYGIFFPQRAEKIKEDARSAIWQSGKDLAQYGFNHLRDDTGKIVGIQHHGGDKYKFGTKEYHDKIYGDAKRAADLAYNHADHEHGPKLPPGSFMGQPAFKAVGISDADRAAGKTWHETNEGRVHLVTRPDGKVEVIPNSTWLKGGHLPVVFENADTKAMASAAKEAIEKIPHEARRGQVYAPDIMKTDSGYKVVELNAQGDQNGSGYLHDNHFTIDSYVSHLTGREPMHVSFIRDVLSKRRGK